MKGGASAPQQQASNLERVPTQQDHTGRDRGMKGSPWFFLETTQDLTTKSREKTIEKTMPCYSTMFSFEETGDLILLMGKNGKTLGFDSFKLG